MRLALRCLFFQGIFCWISRVVKIDFLEESLWWKGRSYLRPNLENEWLTDNDCLFYSWFPADTFFVNYVPFDLNLRRDTSTVSSSTLSFVYICTHNYSTADFTQFAEWWGRKKKNVKVLCYIQFFVPTCVYFLLRVQIILDFVFHKYFFNRSCCLDSLSYGS